MLSGSPTIQGTNNGAISAAASSKVNIKGGTICATGSKGMGIYCYQNSVTTVTGGTIYSAVSNAIGCQADFTGSGTKLDITAGTIYTNATDGTYAINMTSGFNGRFKAGNISKGRSTCS